MSHSAFKSVFFCKQAKVFHLLVVISTCFSLLIDPNSKKKKVHLSLPSLPPSLSPPPSLSLTLKIFQNSQSALLSGLETTLAAAHFLAATTAAATAAAEAAPEFVAAAVVVVVAAAAAPPAFWFGEVLSLSP